MDIKELYYYKTIVDNKSILRASSVLHIAQPPLSRTIKNLEAELNTTLFIRGRELKLTETGKLLYEKAETILNLTSDIKNDIDELKNTLGQNLNIGIVTSSTSLLYNDNKLEKFFCENQSTKFNITEANTFKLLDLLDKKIIDLAITRTPFDTTHYDYILLDKEPMVLTSNQKASEIIQIKDLDKENIVIYRRFQDILNNLFNKYSVKPNIVAVVDDAKTAILLASSLNIRSIVPLGAYNTFSQNLNKSIIDEASLYTSLTIVKRKNEKLNETYNRLIEILKNKISE